MNAFADWLFSVLLGWTSTAANSVWNSVVNAAGSISGFFTRFWLPIVILLILGGTLLDYTVWFVRWRPYLVWRSWLRRRSRHRKDAAAIHELDRSNMDDGTLNTIAGWVASPQDAQPVEQVSSSFYAQDGYAATPLIFEQEQVQHTPYFQPVQEEPALQEPFPDAYEEQLPFAPDDLHQAPAVSWEIPPVAYPYSEEEQSLSPAPARRRRRSDLTRGATARMLLDSLKDRIGQVEDEDSMLDGLPSPVRPEDAFHEPVYPPNYRYQPSPPPNQSTGASHDNELP